MNYGKLNLTAGAIALLLAALGGIALGATFDRDSIQGGNHVLSEVRFYLREGHSHGMPIALLNLIVGLAIDKLALSNLWKRIASIAAVCAFVLPIGLASKGAAGAPAAFPPFGLIGILGFVLTAGILAVGAFRLQRTN